LSAGVVLHVLIIHTIPVLIGLQTGLVLNPLKDDLLVVLYNLVHRHKTEGINHIQELLEVRIPMEEGDEVNVLKLPPDGLPHVECACRPLQWWRYSRCSWFDFKDPTERKMDRGQQTGGFFAQLYSF
jgi:hypothetical protein